jgi:glycine/D-amino acid oxidase-like deaminating enzyme
MDLRSGLSYWRLKSGLPWSYSCLRANEICDVAIVGAGVTGALLAHALVQEGREVVVLDKRDVASGSTAASTSLLQYEADTELVTLIGQVGEANAVRSYKLGLEAVGRVEMLAGEFGDACGFARRSSLYLASKPGDVKTLKAEYECRRRFGFDVEYLAADKVRQRFGFSAPGAILSAGDAVVDAYSLTHCLLHRASQNGARIYDRTAVAAVDRHADKFIIATDREHSVTAKNIVFATGYESAQFLGYDPGPLQSTFAVASEPLDASARSPGDILIWETARPYNYMRSTLDNRVIIGGADEPYATDHSDEGIIEAKTQELIRRFHDYYPDTRFEADYAWGGTFGETKDGLAYIGQVAGRPGIHFALGYGGNGITMSVVAARIITDHICGRPNPDAHIFRFGR